MQKYHYEGRPASDDPSLLHPISYLTGWVDGMPTSEVTRSLSGKSLHLTLVTKWSWAWSWMTYSHSPCSIVQMLIGPFWDKAISKYDHDNPWSRTCIWSRSKSLLTLKIQRSGSWPKSNPLVTFEVWSSIDIFAFCFLAIGQFSVEIYQIPYMTLRT